MATILSTWTRGASQSGIGLEARRTDAPDDEDERDVKDDLARHASDALFTVSQLDVSTVPPTCRWTVQKSRNAPGLR